MKKQYFFSFVLAILSVIAAKSIVKFGAKSYYHEKAISFQKEDGYFDLEHANSIQQLPMGNAPLTHLSMIDSVNYVCIQSQTGNVVLYNIDSNRVSSPLNFGLLKPFRDVIVVDSSLFLFDDDMSVYRSHAPFDSMSTVKLVDGNTDFKSGGICLHAITHRLFIIKDVPLNDTENSKRAVYTYNLNKTQFIEEPLFTFDVEDLDAFAEKNNVKIGFFKQDEFGDTIHGLSFIPTAIAVHPKTNEIYILSSVDKTIAVFNQFGELVNMAVLTDRAFSNPSGMTFNALGDLFISNNDLINNSIVRVNWNKLFQKKSTNSLIFGL